VGMGTGSRVLMCHGGPPRCRGSHDSANDSLWLKLRPVMAMFARQDIGAHTQGRFIDHQRFAGQGTPRGFTPFFHAMLTGFEAVAIDDFDPRAFKPRGAFTTHVLDERSALASAGAHQLSRGMRLSAIAFVIDRDER